ncbi:hypothetical protein DWW77_03380 [Ruminococcus sp. AF17-12]|nr:hypothetical protein DWW77_03380 [Ruminococcus sp. AF17-12]
MARAQPEGILLYGSVSGGGLLVLRFWKSALLKKVRLSERQQAASSELFLMVLADFQGLRTNAQRKPKTLQKYSLRRPSRQHI